VNDHTKISALGYFLLFLSLIMLVTDQSKAQDTKYIHSLTTSEDGGLLVEDFEGDSVGQLPYNWFEQRGVNRPYNYPEDIKKDYLYRITDEQSPNSKINQFLRFDGTKAKHLNFPLHQVKNLNLNESPVLSWKWRIWDIPAGADERNDKVNDTAASVYVVFKVKRMALVKEVPQSIRYTWSSSLPVGTEISTFFGHQKIIVVGTGQPSNLDGEWMAFFRNLKDDYERLFGEKMPTTPLAILLLSDGDSTNDSAKADYDDIEFYPTEHH
jgi:hypothetical protein